MFSKRIILRVFKTLDCVVKALINFTIPRDREHNSVGLFFMSMVTLF